MRYRSPVLVGTLLAAAALSSLGAYQSAPARALPLQSGEKPAAPLDADVAALYKQMNAAYKGLKSYRHTAVYTQKAIAPDGEHKHVRAYQLALTRPNKFVFKSDDPNADAIACDGKTLINYRQTSPQTREYVQTDAPAALKNINLVDDVMFEPQGTYLVALALQGDMLADKDLARVISNAKMGANVQENGRSYQTAIIKAGQDATMTLYVDADTHRLNKVVQKALRSEGSVVEEFKDVEVNKPVPDSLFAYTPPASAQKVAHLSGPDDELKALAAKYEGKPAPDFTVLDSGGNKVTLSSLKGKVVVVDFWASWCGPCRMVMPTIQEIHDKYAGKGVAVMAVDTWDTKEDCATFLKNNTTYTMPVLLDPAGASDQPNSIARKLYNTPGIPTTLIIDKDGIVRTYAVGAHERDYYFDALKKLGVKIAAR